MRYCERHILTKTGVSRHPLKTHQDPLSRRHFKTHQHPLKTSYQDTSTPSQDTWLGYQDTFSRRHFKTHQHPLKTPFQDVISRHINTLSRHPFKTSFQDTSTTSQDTLSRRHFKTHQQSLKTPFQDVISGHINTPQDTSTPLKTHQHPSRHLNTLSRHLNTLSRHYFFQDTYQPRRTARRSFSRTSFVFMYCNNWSYAIMPGSTSGFRY